MLKKRQRIFELAGKKVWWAWQCGNIVFPTISFRYLVFPSQLFETLTILANTGRDAYWSEFIINLCQNFQFCDVACVHCTSHISWGIFWVWPSFYKNILMFMQCWNFSVIQGWMDMSSLKQPICNILFIQRVDNVYWNILV